MRRQYFRSKPEANLKNAIFQLFFFNIFVFDLNRDPFAEAKYVICLKIEKANPEIFAFENAKRRSQWLNG